MLQAIEKLPCVVCVIQLVHFCSGVSPRMNTAGAAQVFAYQVTHSLFSLVDCFVRMCQPPH